MDKVFKSNTWLLILDPEVRLWDAKLKRLRQNEKKQTITISIAAGNYDTEIIIDLINQVVQDFRVKYQESSVGFENLAYLQSIENKCKCSSHIAIKTFDRTTLTHTNRFPIMRQLVLVKEVTNSNQCLMLHKYAKLMN